MTAPTKSRDTVAWNPRAHPLTRPPRLSYQDYTVDRKNGAKSSPRTAAAVGGLSGDPGTQTTNWLGLSTPLTSADKDMELGWLRTSPTIKDMVSQPYGVVFHYNPTDVQLSMGVSSDLTLGSDTAPHTAMPIGSFGSSTVSLTIYLNRIYDMNGSPKDYPVALGSTPEGEDHWTMLRQLGTQWDVEFLLRAINPNPKTDALLPYKTADVGVLPPGPVEIHLGPLAWRGIPVSLSVNHILFTPDFVPTFTTVQISLQRLVTVDQEEVTDSSTSSSDSSDASTSDADKKKAAAAKAKAAADKKKSDAAAAAAAKKANADTNIAKKSENGLISVFNR